MTTENLNKIFWANDGVSVPYDSFYNYACKHRFSFIFNYPNDIEPLISIATKNLQELKRQVIPIHGDDWKRFIKLR